jgi:hypothetical protein
MYQISEVFMPPDNRRFIQILNTAINKNLYLPTDRYELADDNTGINVFRVTDNQLRQLVFSANYSDITIPAGTVPAKRAALQYIFFLDDSLTGTGSSLSKLGGQFVLVRANTYTGYFSTGGTAFVTVGGINSVFYVHAPVTAMFYTRVRFTYTGLQPQLRVRLVNVDAATNQDYSSSVTLPSNVPGTVALGPYNIAANQFHEWQFSREPLSGAGIVGINYTYLILS